MLITSHYYYSFRKLYTYRHRTKIIRIFKKFHNIWVIQYLCNMEPCTICLMIKHSLTENITVNIKKIKKIYCMVIFMKDKIPMHLKKLILIIFSL